MQENEEISSLHSLLIEVDLNQENLTTLLVISSFINSKIPVIIKRSERFVLSITGIVIKSLTYPKIRPSRKFPTKPAIISKKDVLIK